MKPNHAFALAGLLGALPLIGACTPAAPDGGDTETAPATWLGQTVEKATGKAREALKTQPVSVGESSNGTPRAQISADGELLVDGEPVPATPEQRELLLEHRGNIVAIAEAGMAIGTSGADLGMKAAAGALKHAFSGGDSDFEARIEAEAEKIRAEALALCELIPAAVDSQDRLAAAMPEFAPYATMDLDDVESCRSEVKEEAAAR